MEKRFNILKSDFSIFAGETMQFSGGLAVPKANCCCYCITGRRQ